MKEYCDRCQTETESSYLKDTEKNHIQNLCCFCKTRRGLNPYITQKKFDKLVSLNLITPSGSPKGARYENPR